MWYDDIIISCCIIISWFCRSQNWPLLPPFCHKKWGGCELVLKYIVGSLLDTHWCLAMDQTQLDNWIHMIYWLMTLQSLDWHAPANHDMRWAKMAWSQHPGAPRSITWHGWIFGDACSMCTYKSFGRAILSVLLPSLLLLPLLLYPAIDIFTMEFLLAESCRFLRSWGADDD